MNDPTHYVIRLRFSGDKRAVLLASPTGSTTRRRVRAMIFRSKEEANKTAAEISKENPHVIVKVARI